MKRFERILFVSALFVLVIGLCGCKKAANDTSNTKEDNSELLTDKVILPENTALSGINLKDTINNIRGSVVFAVNTVKDSSVADLTPVNAFWQQDLRAFTTLVKANDKAIKEDTNRYFLSVKYIYATDEIISAMFEKNCHISGGDTEVKSIISLNYDIKKAKILKFFDVFRVNDGNLKDFNRVFNSDFKLEELKDVDFNIEHSNISVNVNKDGNTVKRYSVKKEKAAKFLMNDK